MSRPRLAAAAALGAPLAVLLLVLDAGAPSSVSLGQEVELMRQDMAGFATDGAATTSRRRAGARPLETFAA